MANNAHPVDGALIDFSMVKREMVEDFLAGAKHLTAHAECSGKVGAVGFCFGGMGWLEGDGRTGALPKGSLCLSCVRACVRTCRVVRVDEFA